MTTQKTLRACIDWMMVNEVSPYCWKVTDKSLVYYDSNKRRTVVPLTRVFQEVA